MIITFEYLLGRNKCPNDVSRQGCWRNIIQSTRVVHINIVSSVNIALNNIHQKGKNILIIFVLPQKDTPTLSADDMKIASKRCTEDFKSNTKCFESIWTSLSKNGRGYLSDSAASIFDCYSRSKSYLISAIRRFYPVTI